MNIKKSLVTIALIGTFGLNAAMAEKGLSIDEVGHLSFTQQGVVQKKIATATTVISRYSDNKATVKVSQVFANDSKSTISAEYFFPIPENGNLVDFKMQSDYELATIIPEKTVTLDKGDKVTVAYQYEVAEDSNYHASLMSFPAEPARSAKNKSVDLVKLIAKK